MISKIWEYVIWNNKLNVPEYGFSPILIFLSKDSIFDSVRTRENTEQIKPVSW